MIIKEDGTKIVGMYIEGYKHGVHEITYQKDNVKMTKIYEFENGAKHGSYKKLTEDGNLIEQGWFKDGYKQGQNYKKDKDGNSIRSVYKEGQKHGLSITTFSEQEEYEE